MKGHQQATSLSVLFDSRTDKNGRSLLHPLRAGQKPKKLTGRKREKGAEDEGREGRRGLADKSTVFLFILPPLFFFFLTFFLLSPFLLSNCCHVFNIRCNLFQTLGWGEMERRGAHSGTAAIFTLQPDTKTGKHHSAQSTATHFIYRSLL